MNKEVVMSKKEVSQIAIFDAVANRKMTQKEASRLTNLSIRQVNRKALRYKKYGYAGLIHKSRGKKGNRAIDQDIKQKILELLRGKYSGYGPTLAAEKLFEYENIKIDHETLRKLMIKNHLWEKKKRKRKTFVWRERKHHAGEMVLADGSKHIWFGNEYSTLVAFIDDATSMIELYFDKEETIESISTVTKLYLEKYGRPRSIYTDRGKVFKVNNVKDGIKHFTQYQKMLSELDITLIHAYSPQAKGRVERLFRTLQDWLPKELKLRGVKTTRAANKFLQDIFIEYANKKLAVEPKSDVNLHQSIEDYDLNSIFCLKYQRRLNNDNTIVYKNRFFLLAKQQSIILHNNEKVTVNVSFDKTIVLTARGHRLNYKEIEKRPKQEKKPERVRKLYIHKPSANHPWRSYSSQSFGTESDISKKFKR